MRSIAAAGIEFTSMKEAWPLAKELTLARRLLIKVRVEPVPRPRREAEEDPTGVSLDSAPAVAVVKVPVPPPVTVRSCISSPMRCAPDSRISSRFNWMACVPPLRSRPLMWEPVTRTSSRGSSWAAAPQASSASALAQARDSGWKAKALRVGVMSYISSCDQRCSEIHRDWCSHWPLHITASNLLFSRSSNSRSA